MSEFLISERHLQERVFACQNIITELQNFSHYTQASSYISLVNELQKHIHVLSAVETFTIIEEEEKITTQVAESNNIEQNKTIFQENVSCETFSEPPVSDETNSSTIQREEEESGTKYRIPKIKTEESDANFIKEELPNIILEEEIQDILQPISEISSPSFSVGRNITLDLNDHYIFTKTLFSGNSEELKKCIEHLKLLNTQQECKEYLSELYYDKNWKKHDEEAQRLWQLVEESFV